MTKWFSLKFITHTKISMHKSWLKVAVLAFLTLDFFYQER